MKHNVFKDFERRTGVHFTEKHTGKMRGMFSLSTACTVNPRCIERAKVPGTICEKCYAASMLEQYKNLDACTGLNAAILTKKEISVDTFPRVDASIFPYGRYEAFGDLFPDERGAVQFINYTNMCIRNPDIKFALWTKNPDVVAYALQCTHSDGTPVRKPRNLVIIYSAPVINTAPDVDKLRERYPFIDKVFTVYDKAHAAGVNINCGARNCRECGRCYSKRTGREVREILK